MSRERHHGVTEQTKAGKHRLEDARCLLQSQRWRGSMYMAGYAVECLLKSKLMRLFGCRHLRNLEEELHRRGTLAARDTIFTHQLEDLLDLTQASTRLRQQPSLWRAFNRVNRWVPAWRYSADPARKAESEAFFDAVEKTLQWVESNC